MTITEYIAALEVIRTEHGELEVETWNVGFNRVSARPPEVAYCKILKGRQSKPSFYSRFDDEDRKGKKVCRV